MRAAGEPISVLIAALGGQGGGVLTDWLADAVRLVGYPVQATSIPGVAQRTGATTYYLEMAPSPAPAPKPRFALYPDRHGVDLLVALEPVEAARALRHGLVTARTTVITSAERIFSTSEKMVAGDGTAAVAELLAPMTSAARAVFVVDPPEKGGRPAGNAVFLGAVATEGGLPLEAGAFRRAVVEKGVGVEANLADFETGLHAARAAGDESGPAVRYDPAPGGFEADLLRFPENARALVGHALARLVDYQGGSYARLYLDRLGRLLAAKGGSDEALLKEVARRLAARMAYEDVIRVAQLKTRPGRLTRIRRDLGLGEGDPFRVVDFLKPGREELASLLPPGLGRRLETGADDEGGVPLRFNITSARGFAAMRVLAALRPWRRHSYRYQREQRDIEVWLAAVIASAGVDTSLARAVAELALLVRGYGDVRARGADRLQAFLAGWPDRLARDRAGLLIEVKALLEEARHNPDAACAREG